jgi:hypothetical protein
MFLCFLFVFQIVIFHFPIHSLFFPRHLLQSLLSTHNLKSLVSCPASIVLFAAGGGGFGGHGDQQLPQHRGEVIFENTHTWLALEHTPQTETEAYHVKI